ncbi:MAG: helix-turn-helix domain-containing protein [Candidatus Dormibacteraceae bacterium]
MNSLLIQLGRRVRELRTKRGWSQEEFGLISGLHRTFVAHIELGHKNLSFDSLTTLTTHLGVSLERLVSGLEDRARADDLAAPGAEPTARTAKVRPVPELQRFLTQLRGQRASLDRTISALEEFANRGPHNRPKGKKPTRGGPGKKRQ